jgi:hypothetical protein
MHMDATYQLFKTAVLRSLTRTSTRLVRVRLLALLLGASHPLCAAQISIGTLTLDWPEGFTNQRFGDALLLIGPNEERVVISYLRGGNGFSEKERARFIGMHRSFAVRALPRSAAERGIVVQQLDTNRLGNGAVIYSIASQAPQGTDGAYFLEYFLVGPFSAALFKIEGRGNALSRKRSLDVAFMTAHWNEAVVSGRLR